MYIKRTARNVARQAWKNKGIIAAMLAASGGGPTYYGGIGPSGKATSSRSSTSSSKSRVRTKRKRKTKKNGGSVGHGTAWKKVKKVTLLRGKPNVNRKFKAKVEKVISYGKPFGEYCYMSDARLHQDVKNEWNVVAADNNAKAFEQFSMAQVWDAASIMFNDKVVSNSWDNDIAEGANHNVRYKQAIHVINSYTLFEFKSTSSHVVNIEMYICTPRSNVVTDLPHSLAEDTNVSMNTGYFYLNAAEAVTAGTFNAIQNEGSASYMWSQMHKEFTVQKVQLKFNPGEQKKHFLQGPKNYTYDGTKGILYNGTTPGVMKCQKYVWFRIINDPTVSGVSSGTTPTETIARWPSNYQGGVAMRQKRIIRVRCPDTLDADAFVDLAENRQNSYVIGQFCRIDALDVDQQVTVENPIAKATSDI